MCAACLKLIYIVLPWFFACRSSRAKPSLLKRAAKCASAIAMPLDLLARQVCATLQRCCMVFAVTPKSHQQAPLLGAWIAIHGQTSQKHHQQNPFETATPMKPHHASTSHPNQSSRRLRRWQSLAPKDRWSPPLRWSFGTLGVQACCCLHGNGWYNPGDPWYPSNM